MTFPQNKVKENPKNVLKHFLKMNDFQLRKFLLFLKCNQEALIFET